jgi:hypothetical protein
MEMVEATKELLERRLKDLGIEKSADEVLKEFRQYRRGDGEGPTYPFPIVWIAADLTKGE